MIKEFNKFKLDHNNFDGAVRGEWRKFNPYNPDAGTANEAVVNDLNVDSLDDLFDEDNSSEKNSNNDDFLGESDNDTATSDNTKKEDKNDYSMSDDELNELLFDDESNENNSDDSNTDEILDIQKELEAKFDELFGDSDDE